MARLKDGDFQTLRSLLDRKALGKVMEAELHYDFESPAWIMSNKDKEYTPGAGLTFGLGESSCQG